MNFDTKGLSIARWVNCDVCGSMVEFLDDCDCAEIMGAEDWADGPDSEAGRAARGEGTRLVFNFDGTEVRLSYDTIGRSWMWHADGRAGGARTVSEALFYCGIWLGRREARRLVVEALEEFS